MINQTKNKGIQNEHEFIEYLNHKKIKELNPMAYDFVVTLFPNINDNDIIYAIPRLDKGKTDFVIRINETNKNISVKMGYSNSVHLERLDSFIDFLQKIKVDENTIKQFIKFHYADDTIDNSGINRISSEEYKKRYQTEIDEINLVFNEKTILQKAIDHFLFNGRYHSNVDALVHGTVNDFLWLTKEEIYKIMFTKKDDYTTGVHFGILYCQPWSRNLQYKNSEEYKREYVQIKWYNILDNIIEIMALHRKKE